MLNEPRTELAYTKVALGRVVRDGNDGSVPSEFFAMKTAALVQCCQPRTFIRSVAAAMAGGTGTSSFRRFCIQIAIISAASSALVFPCAADQISFFSTGAGKQKCADYLHASQGLDPNALQYNQRSQRTFVSDNAIYDHWIFGFLSAINLASASDGNKNPDIQVRNIDIIAWIRGWCADHPDAAVFDGAYSFVKDQWARKRPN